MFGIQDFAEPNGVPNIHDYKWTWSKYNKFMGKEGTYEK